MRRIKMLAFSSAALADDLPSVSFSDGQYVKLGYAAEPPSVWEAKPLTGERLFFLGSPASIGGSYGDTSAWENSNVRRYLNETYLTETFSPDELAIGLLLPYGDSPVYNFDDAAQGLNNTKGAILREANPHFGLPEAALETVIEKSGGGDGGGDGDCKCDVNAGACLCGTESSPENCGCSEEEREELRIITDTTLYLVRGQPFFLGLDAENGEAPYTWKIDGTLPDGLNFSEEGMIEGTPAVEDIFRVTFFVSDSDNAKESSKKFTFLVVEDEKLAIMTDTLPDAQTGIFYTARIRGSGGTKPYGWEIDSLPGWLRLELSSGILYGMPIGAAIHDLMIRVKDSEGAIETAPLRLSVYPHNGLTVAARILPTSRHGQDYSARLEVSEGIPPHYRPEWRIGKRFWMS